MQMLYNFLTHMQEIDSKHLWNFMNMLPVDVKLQKFVLRLCFKVSVLQQAQPQSLCF